MILLSLRLSHILTLLFVLSIAQGVTAQDRFQRSLQQEFQEKAQKAPFVIYVHLNKTRFIPGEELFFSAYLIDTQTGLPALEPSTLRLGLYDEEGQQVKQTLWPFYEGVASGNLMISNSLQGVSYWLKADLPFRQELPWPNRFLERIEILRYEPSAETADSDDVFIKIVPEGGQFLSDLINTVGFRVYDAANHAVQIETAWISDVKGREILSSIKANVYGMGKFDLLMDADSEYRLNLRLKDGRQFTRALPKPRDEGFALNVTGNQQRRMVTIRTNVPNSPSVTSTPLYLVVEQAGKSRSLPVNFKDGSLSIAMDPEDFFPGLNTLNLIDKNKNVWAERLLFNPEWGRQHKLSIEELSQDSDSLYLSILDGVAAEVPVDLSVSVLAAESEVGGAEGSIVPRLFYGPFLEADAPIISVFVEGSASKKYQELDLLMMIYGLGHKEGTNLEKNRIQDAGKQLAAKENPADQGIWVEGELLDFKPEKMKSVFMFQDNIQEMEMSTPDAQGHFTFLETSIRKDETVHFTLLNQKGKMRKPEVQVRFGPRLKKDTIPKEVLAEFMQKEGHGLQKAEGLEKAQRTGSQNQDLGRWLSEKRIQLDDVTLIAKARDESPSRNTKLNTGVWEAKKINEEDVLENQHLSRYLRRAGFKVTSSPLTGMMSVQARSNLRYRIQRPVIYLNGFRQMGPIQDFPMDMIDEVYYEHFGLMESNGGSIQIYLLDGSFVGQKADTDFASVQADVGYDSPKVYQALVEQEDLDERFLKYGCLYWTPTLPKTGKGEWTLSFPHLGVERMLIRVEGFGQDGTLYSETFVVDLSKEE